MSDPLDLDALAELERESPELSVWMSAFATSFCSRVKRGESNKNLIYLAALVTHARTLIAEARRARALEKYACHPWTCSSMVVRFTDSPEVPCDCGLDALLRREDERG